MKERETFELDTTIIKKARQKSYRRMIWTSAVVVVTSLVTCSILAWQWNSWRLNQKMIQAELEYDVYGMNRYIGNFEESVRPCGATAQALTYSLVAGQPADVIVLNAPFNTPSAYLEPNDTTRYLQNGHKLKLWYAPEVTYAKLANDREILRNMPATKRVELAVSFDRSFTIEEWKKVAHNDITMAYWIDDEQPVDDQPIDERFAMGISLQDEGGDWLENPVAHFVESAERLAKDTRDKQLQATITKWQAHQKIRGVVLVGSPQQLYEATSAPFVRATSIGTMIDYYEEDVQ